jgi:hypothetical protein
MIVIANFAYAGTDKFVSHAVMLSFEKPPHTLCGMDVYGLLNRVGQEWEVEELKGSLIVGCKKCNRHLERRAQNTGASSAVLERNRI